MVNSNLILVARSRSSGAYGEHPHIFRLHPDSTPLARARATVFSDSRVVISSEVACVDRLISRRVKRNQH